MPILLNRVNPALSIYNPATGKYARFVGGRLDIEEGHPDYAVVMAAAARNPNITVTAKVVACPECGQQFLTGTAQLELGKHRKAEHPGAGKAKAEPTTRNVIVSQPSGFACDQCPHTAPFPTADDLALHVRLLHGAPFETPDGRGVPEAVREQLGSLPSGG